MHEQDKAFLNHVNILRLATIGLALLVFFFSLDVDICPEDLMIFPALSTALGHPLFSSYWYFFICVLLIACAFVAFALFLSCKYEHKAKLIQRAKELNLQRKGKD